MRSVDSTQANKKRWTSIFAFAHNCIGINSGTNQMLWSISYSMLCNISISEGCVWCNIQTHKSILRQGRHIFSSEVRTKKFQVGGKRGLTLSTELTITNILFFFYILTTSTSIQVKGNTLCFVWYPLRDSWLNSKLVKMQDQLKLSVTKYGSISWFFFCSCKMLHQIFREIPKGKNIQKKMTLQSI